MANQANDTLILKNVRLSFPSLYKSGSYAGTETGKYEATFLLPKSDEAQYKKLMALVDASKKANPKMRVGADKVFVKDGDDVSETTEGYWVVTTGKRVASGRPVLLSRSADPVAEDDNLFYAGCFVNAKIGAWVQDNSYGKRINGNFSVIQFVKDGEALGGGGMDSSTDEFEDMGDEEEL